MNIEDTKVREKLKEEFTKAYIAGEQNGIRVTINYIKACSNSFKEQKLMVPQNTLDILAELLEKEFLSSSEDISYSS